MIIKSEFQMFQIPNITLKGTGFGHLRFEFWSLFRLPARSRFGEGREFDIRISDLSLAYHVTPLCPATPPMGKDQFPKGGIIPSLAKRDHSAYT